MEKRIIITSGKKYIDIDAYAGIFAYKHLLENIGYSVYAYNNAIENESICTIIKDMNYQFDRIEILPEDQFIVLDLSNPEFFYDFINEKNTIEIIDHHTGFEQYWNDLKVKNQIEFIGSICTIIYERYVESGKENLLDQRLCKLLIAGILDNTLNLKGSITTTRDIKAYRDLLKLGQIEDHFRNDYFASCYQNLENNLIESIQNDIKIEYISDYLPEVFGQLLVLDIKTIIEKIGEIESAFSKYDSWIFNVMSLVDGKSYIFFHRNGIKEKLETLFQLKIEGNYFVLEHFLLRKQIMKLAREKK